MNPAHLCRMLDAGWRVEIIRGVFEDMGHGYVCRATHRTGSIPESTAMRLAATIRSLNQDEPQDVIDLLIESELSDGMLAVDHPSDPMQALEAIALKVLGEIA